MDDKTKPSDVYTTKLSPNISNDDTTNYDNVIDEDQSKDNGARWKHIMVTPFGVSHYIIFQGCACLSVSHFKFSKDVHNFFAYYVRI